MTTLHFPATQHLAITDLVRRCNKRDPNPYLSFIFEGAQYYIIGGETDNLVMLGFDNVNGLPDGRWSVSASAFENYWHEQRMNIRDKKTIEFEVSNDTGAFPLMEGVTQSHSFRYLRAMALCESHLAFFEGMENKSFLELETSKAQQLCSLADDCQPYDVIEFDHEEKAVRIQRDNDIISIEKGEELALDFSMAITPEANMGLQSLATHSDSTTLHVYLDDEQAIFTDRQHSFSYSLASLQHYFEMRPKHFQLEAKMIIDIETFTKELGNFQKISEIKQTNQVLFYVTASNVYLAGIHSQTGGVYTLSTKDISTGSNVLYSINLSVLSKVKIKHLTEAKQIKLTILRSKHGELKLGFHNDKDSQYAYDSVPLELATVRLPELLQIIERAQSLDGDHFGEQQDLFGFDDV